MSEDGLLLIMVAIINDNGSSNKAAVNWFAILNVYIGDKDYRVRRYYNRTD